MALKFLLLLVLATAVIAAVHKPRGTGSGGKDVDKHRPHKLGRPNSIKHTFKPAKRETAKKNKSKNKKKKPGVSGQIYNGIEGAENMPWMAYIETVNADNHTVHQCSGVVVNETKVVTAAQCLERGNISYVTVGNIDRTHPDAVTLTVPSTMWIIPKEFVYNGAISDVAIFNLSTPLTFGTNLQAMPFCPKSMYKDKKIMENLPVTIHGFGHVESTDPDCVAPDGPSLIFNTAETLTVNSSDHCSRKLREDYQTMDPKYHYCTTSNFNETTPGSCDSDVGGPVSHTIAGATSPCLVGILSSFFHCPNKYPATFTNAAVVMKFLEKASGMKQPK